MLKQQLTTVEMSFQLIYKHNMVSPRLMSSVGSWKLQLYVKQDIRKPIFP